MSGVSIDVSQVSELVDNTGYPVMMEAYEAVPLVYPALGELVDPSDLASPFYGEKGSVLEGMERFMEREDGQDIERSTFETAYTWYLKCRQYARSITIPSRLLRSSDNLGKIGNMISKAAAEWGEISRLQKEDYVADMFQKGTLTAGSRPFFDGSFPGNADPNPAFIYDAAMAYASEGTPLIVIGGTEYGAGSSRDWAAKGTRLLGVKVIIARSYERIHRSNLVGMGVLPLEFRPGDSAESLGLKGDESFDIKGIQGPLSPGCGLRVTARSPGGSAKEFDVTCRLDSDVEIDYFRNGGILQSIVRKYLRNADERR